MARIFAICFALLIVQCVTGAEPAAKKEAATKKVPPFAKLTVAQPAAQQTVSGCIDVCIKAELPDGASMPVAMLVGLGGAPWTPLAKKGDTGEWAGQLNSTLVPNGPQKLIVLTDNKRANISIDVVVSNPLQVFFGDLHSHTSYSDGTLAPAVAHDYARNTSKLDIFCLTDHLEGVSDDEWLDMRRVAFAANEDGKFVSFPGLEWTKKWGHINIYDPKTRVWPEDPAEFYKAAADAGVVLKFNHPGDGTVTHDGLAYSEAGDKAMQLMEVRSDVEEKAFIRALNNGWHIAPDGSDDTHSPNWGNVKTWTGILVPGLSERNVLDALKNRRTYSTLDRNCRLGFEVNRAAMGSVLEEPCSSVQLAIHVEDPDAGDNISLIEVFEDGNAADRCEPNAAKHQWELNRPVKPGKHYYFAKVKQADGNVIWSAPVWITGSGQ